jgi:hypothetical protein
MRTTVAAGVLLGLAALPLRADPAQDLVERAVKAHGGTSALERARTLRYNATGTIAAAGKDVPFTSEVTWQLPGRYRVTLDLGTGQDRSQVVRVVTPDKGWQTTGGMVTELGPDRLEELQEEAYVLWLFTLVPLLKEPGFDLSPLPEVQVGGRAALGVKVAHKGHADVRLYFDKETGLLVQIERRAREGGLPVQKRYVYANHKEFDGVRLPTREAELTTGQPTVELKDITYRLLRGVNDSTFAKP